MSDNVELVRRLWSAFEKGGMDAVYEIVDPDVEWQPYGGGGVIYSGRDGLRRYMEEQRSRGEETEARLYSAFAKGDFVVARGEVRIRGEHGIVTMQPGWLYEFREGKLVRILDDWKADQRPVSFVYPQQEFVPKKLTAFLEVATEIIREDFAQFAI